MTVLFYDFLLTLKDEVKNVIGIALQLAYRPFERSNMLGTDINHGVGRKRRSLRGIH